MKQLSNLLEEYQIPFPVITLDDNKKLDHKAQTSAVIYYAHIVPIILFNPEYTKQLSFPYLKWTLGHELAHKYLNTQAMHENSFNEIQKYDSLAQSLCISGYGAAIAYTFLINPSLYIVLGSMGLLLTQHAYLWNQRRMSKPLQQNEADCDAMGIDIFGRTIQEKIDMCQESIDFFHARVNAISTTDKINTYVNYYTMIPTDHPYDWERIVSIEKIKSTLEEIQEQNYTVDNRDLSLLAFNIHNGKFKITKKSTDE